MKSRWIVGALLALALALGIAWLSNASDSPGVTSSAPPVEAIASVPDARTSVESVSPLSSDERAVDPRVTAISTSDASSDTAAVVATAEFRGRVIRQSDSRPLTEFLLEIQDEPRARADQSIFATTDRFGQFIAPVPLAIGAVIVHLRDHIEQSRMGEPIVFAADAWPSREVEIALEPGATFFLDITPNHVAVSELEAEWLAERLPSSGDLYPIREGDPPWVRFSTRELGPDGHNRIRLQSRDFVWRGEADVRRGGGVEPEIVRVRLEPLASLRGTVLGAEGVPLEDAAVSVRMATGPDPRLRFAETNAEGEFSFPFLPPGRAEIGVALFGFETIEKQAVDLVAGESATRTISLQPLAYAGSIRVRVTSDTGDFDAPSWVALSMSSDGVEFEHVKYVTLDWSGAPGKRTATCEFKDLPLAKYRVVPMTTGEEGGPPVQWEPPRLEAFPPSVLEFRVRDAK
jgi:hypothetical protein